MRRNRFSILIAVTMSVVTLVMPLLGEGPARVRAQEPQATVAQCSNPKLRSTKIFTQIADAFASGTLGLIQIDIVLKNGNVFVVSPPGSPQKGDTPYVGYLETHGTNIFDCAQLIAGQWARFFIQPFSASGSVRFEVYCTKFKADGSRARKRIETVFAFASRTTAQEAQAAALASATDQAVAVGFQILDSSNTSAAIESSGQYLGIAFVPNNLNEADVTDPADSEIQPIFP